MWCAILANRQIQLRDLHSVKDLSTNLNTHTHKDTLTHTHTKTLTHTYTQNQGLAEHPGCGLWWSSITPHRWIYFLPSIMLGVPDLAARQTWVQITALLLTSCLAFGRWPHLSLSIFICTTEVLAVLTLQGCCGDREKVCKVLSTEASSAQQTTVIHSSFSFFSFFSSSSLLPAPFLLSFAPSSFSHLPPPTPQHQPPARPAPAGVVQPPGIQGPADLWCAGRVQNEVMKGLFIHTASFTKDYWKFPWLKNVWNVLVHTDRIKFQILPNWSTGAISPSSPISILPQISYWPVPKILFQEFPSWRSRNDSD